MKTIIRYLDPLADYALTTKVLDTSLDGFDLRLVRALSTNRIPYVTTPAPIRVFGCYHCDRNVPHLACHYKANLWHDEPVHAFLLAQRESNYRSGLRGTDVRVKGTCLECNHKYGTFHDETYAEGSFSDCNGCGDRCFVPNIIVSRPQQ